MSSNFFDRIAPARRKILLLAIIYLGYISLGLPDKIYFVPIDYVQESMSKLFMIPEKNRTYHITGDSPVSTDMIGVACRDILKVTGLRTVDKNDDPSKDEKLVMRMIEDLIPYFSTQITFDNSNVRADLGDEILNWKLDVPFLRRMAYSYYKQELPGIVEGMEIPTE